MKNLYKVYELDELEYIQEVWEDDEDFSDFSQNPEYRLELVDPKIAQILLLKQYIMSTDEDKDILLCEKLGIEIEQAQEWIKDVIIVGIIHAEPYVRYRKNRKEEELLDKNAEKYKDCSASMDEKGRWSFALKEVL